MSMLLPVVQPQSDFVAVLLRDQRAMSAVDQFSLVHDATDVASEYEPAQARFYRQLLPASPPAPGQQFAFEVDLDKCSGCKACVVACHTMNGLEENEAWRRVGTVSSEFGRGSIQHVSAACHHCEDPGCLRGCPVKAYEKDPATGIVRHLDDQCIGCKYCTMMCPYEVPQYSERLGIVRKCDMCHQRLSAGEAPACVQACPNEAIAIRLTDKQSSNLDPQSDCHVLAPGAADSKLTRPTTVYKTKHAESFATAMPQDEVADVVAESHWPLAVMLVATQASVGVLLGERLAAMFAALTAMPVAVPWPVEAPRYAVTLALIISGIGMNLAPLHLGQPLRAWRVFLGLRTSWLSREAIVLGQYMGLLAIGAALLWVDVVAGYLPAGVADLVPRWAAGVTIYTSIFTGLVGLYCSAMIYIATQRKLWRPIRTFGRFFGTTVVAGLAWTIPVVVLSTEYTSIAAGLALAVVLTTIGKLYWEHRLQLSNSPRPDRYDSRSRRLVVGPLRLLTHVRFGLGAGASVSALAAVVAGTVSPAWPVLLLITAVAAAVLVSAGELCERLLYFCSVVYDRMPGTLR